jgi:uncharacterized membrane protein
MVGKILSETLPIAKNKLFALSQWIPIFTLFAALWIWKDLEVFNTHKGLIMLTVGFIFSLVTSKVIVASLTEMRTSIISFEAVLMLISGLIMKYYNVSKVGV